MKEELLNLSGNSQDMCLFKAVVCRCLAKFSERVTLNSSQYCKTRPSLMVAFLSGQIYILFNFQDGTRRHSICAPQKVE